MRFIALCFFFIVIAGLAGYAQGDTTIQSNTRLDTARPGSMQVLDSVILATANRKKFLEDSLAFLYIKYPDSTVNREAAERYVHDHMYRGNGFLDIPFKSKSILRNGHMRKTRDQWIITIIIGLLLYTAILNIIMNKDIKNVFLSFYSKRALVQANKDDVQINFWAFVGLFLLFGLTFGLFLYQLASYKSIYYSVSGVRLFVSLVMIILLLFAGKFLVLKLIGFIFDIQKIVTEYVSILYLTYFNVAFVFLPVTVCFSLLAAVFIKPLLIVAVILIVIIFVWLYLRSSVNIISNFRFHKFYLFIYLCALEICPILILIKALNI
ncbi:DUF4271 domain-containing protein [Mucilaginibacter sp. UR6-11]|uniref:DUF4271 domain-containing protein n=1 Tax=Mucilaginibacter sp. UR6-11 TaxID=1435644 RepID=UPI001E437CD1|nr:DUF4271 domain-containing protein [Mucilaginibacter sp. UR6-11]MCC8425137.1 DUF4271 domain-containing protein [Mucilaginibacter sp. UR6-11]